MIRQLTGTVTYKNTDSAIITVGGVGYRIFLTPDALVALTDESITLWTHMAVRENSMDLYGFLNPEDLSLFELLLGISGVGPKSALGILSVVTPEMLREAIASGDTSYLTKVSGIGAKSAGRIIIELKDKMGGMSETTESTYKGDADVLDALVGMGYSTKAVRTAMRNLSGKATSVQGRIKETLKLLSNHKQT